MALLRDCSLYFMFILCTLLFLCVNCENGRKSSIDDLIVEFLNATYIDEDTFELSINYKDGENSIRVKMDIINELPPQVFMKIQVWGRALGQYKVPTGISMDVDICDGKFKRYFLDNVLSNIGVDMSHCPPKPGNYGVDDYVLKMEGLPVYGLPGLSVLLDIEMHSPPNITLMKIKSYHRVL